MDTLYGKEIEQTVATLNMDISHKKYNTAGGEALHERILFV